MAQDPQLLSGPHGVPVVAPKRRLVNSQPEHMAPTVYIEWVRSSLVANL